MVILEFYIVYLPLGLFQGQLLLIYFFPTNVSYFLVSLYALWFFVEHWTLESSNVITLEIRFSIFPRVYYFFNYYFFNCCRLFPYHGSDWGISLWTSHIVSVPLPGHAWSLSNYPLICSSWFWKSWYLMYGSQKGEKQKMKVKKRVPAL